MFVVLYLTDARHYLPLTDKLCRFLSLALEDDGLARIHGPNAHFRIQTYTHVLAFYAISLEELTALPAS
ncbi:hypothetical protein [Vibrio neptunius]|uniref:hypothetical protein n=1 Tax=Vibrio neptunius TaxID=170651 RepID=UPI0012FB9440|nr:hypothetical protein [Vibrio neptunius]